MRQKKMEITQLLLCHSVKHRIAGKTLFLKMNNYISLPEDFTASLVALTARHGYVIQLEG